MDERGARARARRVPVTLDRPRDVRELRFTPASRDLHEAISEALVPPAQAP